MNVYVRELSTALARAGVECDVYTRAWSDDLPATVTVEPGLRVHHVPAGPLGPMVKEELPVGRRRVHRQRPVPHDLGGGGRPPPARGDRLRRRARQLLAVGHRRPPHQARARPAPGVDLPHPGPGEGRGEPRGGVERRAPPPGRGRGHGHALLGGRAGLVLGGGRAARRSSTTATRPRIRGRRTRRRPRLLRSRPPAPGAPGPGPARRRSAAAVRGPDPAPQGCRRRRAGAGGDDGPPRRATSSWWEDRAVHAARSTWRSSQKLVDELGLADRVRFEAPATARAALDVLPRRRRLRRAQPVRVLRAGGPRGGRVRDTGGRRGGRRAHHPRRRRAHRHWSSIPRHPRPSPPPSRGSSPTPCWPSAWPPRPWSVPAATPGHRPRRCCVPPTRSSPPSDSSSAADAVDPGPGRVPRADIASAEERAACDARHRAVGRRPPGRRGCRGRRRPPARARSLVPAAARRREGLRHGVAHDPPAHPAPRDAGHAGTRGERRSDLRVPVAPQRRSPPDALRPGRRGRRVPRG